MPLCGTGSRAATASDGNIYQLLSEAGTSEEMYFYKDLHEETVALLQARRANPRNG